MTAHNAMIRAKQLWPEQPGDGEEWTVRLMWLILKSRRASLDESECREFDDLVRSHWQRIVEDWHERWLVSVADTYGESGTGGANGAMLAMSAIRMMEKLSQPRRSLNSYDRACHLDEVDIHRNFMRRFFRLTEGEEHLQELFVELWQRLAESEHSIVGRLNRLSSQSIDEEARAAKNRMDGKPAA